MSAISDDDIKGLGIKIPLFRLWEKLMGDMYNIYVAAQLNPVSVENEIHIGNWRIYIDFVNNSYLQGNVFYNDEERLTVRHVGSDKLFVMAINTVVQPHL